MLAAIGILLLSLLCLYDVSGRKHRRHLERHLHGISPAHVAHKYSGDD